MVAVFLVLRQQADTPDSLPGFQVFLSADTDGLSLYTTHAFNSLEVGGQPPAVESSAGALHHHDFILRPHRLVVNRQ